MKVGTAPDEPWRGEPGHRIRGARPGAEARFAGGTNRVIVYDDDDYVASTVFNTILSGP